MKEIIDEQALYSDPPAGFSLMAMHNPDIALVEQLRKQGILICDDCTPLFWMVYQHFDKQGSEVRTGTVDIGPMLETCRDLNRLNQRPIEIHVPPAKQPTGQFHRLMESPWNRYNGWNSFVGAIDIWLVDVMRQIETGDDAGERLGDQTLLMILFSEDDRHFRAATEISDPAKVAQSTTAYEIAASLLLAGGADLEARDATGRTVLHRVAAARSPVGYTHSIHVLLKLGADPHARDSHGLTPIDLATGDEAAVLSAWIETT